jgi:sulfatase maturation enzyme AslB (radical SAM superfamily)
VAAAKTDAFRPASSGGVPVFRRDAEDYSLFYAPGLLCVTSVDYAREFEGTLVPRDDGWGGSLWHQAKDAVEEMRRVTQEPFSPECLTLYMNNDCNLSCRYCYSDPSPHRSARLDLETIAAGAQLVAGNCADKGLPLTGVFHGGGEPTLDGEHLAAALSALEKAALRNNVGLFRYIATNGVVSERKAAWLGRSFDLVGLSCDGPPDVQDAQRPRLDGGAASHIVERTARILREEGCRLAVRATITAATLKRQRDVAQYIAQVLAPDEIRFEPVYLGGRAGNGLMLAADSAEEFVVRFLDARTAARKAGVELRLSGSRAEEVHGPYCNVFRNTLNLVPGGVATACFKLTDAASVKSRGVAVGAARSDEGRFVIDKARVQELRQRLARVPEVCSSCFNRYHCVRTCPDHCALDGEVAVRDTLRCRLQKGLAEAILTGVAEDMWSSRQCDTQGAGVAGVAVFRSVLRVGAGRSMEVVRSQQL